MSTNSSSRYKIALAVAGAGVIGAILVLGLILTLPDVSGTAIALGVVVVVLASLSGAGIWTHRLALAWIPAIIVLALGFVGIAIGPQIIGVGLLALISALILSSERYL
jgi:integral membrane sensor domain MASE1